MRKLEEDRAALKKEVQRLTLELDRERAGTALGAISTLWFFRFAYVGRAWVLENRWYSIPSI